MAMKRGRQGPWPRVSDNDMTERRAPDGYFVHPDGIFGTPERALAGPLRTGTSPGVGPRGRAVEAADTAQTDMGMDRISPRGFDPMGWPNKNQQAASGLVASQRRRPESRQESMLDAGYKSRRMRP